MEIQLKAEYKYNDIQKSDIAEMLFDSHGLYFDIDEMNCNPYSIDDDDYSWSPITKKMLIEAEVDQYFDFFYH